MKPATKVCAKCGLRKLLDCFWKIRRDRPERQSWCRACQQARDVERLREMRA